MQSHASAATLLSNCTNVARAAPLLAALGFEVPLIPISRHNGERLGLPSGIGNPHLAKGPGALRALVFETSGPLRESIDSAARAVAERPAVLWLLAGISDDGTTAIAAVDASSSRTRIASLTVHRSGIVASDAETACALAAAAVGSDILIHVRWLEILGRDGVGRRFFRMLDTKVQQLADSLTPEPKSGVARELALTCTSRLLFLSFLETRGWLDYDRGFLANGFADCMGRGGGYHRRVLSPLFFGTLNTIPSRRAARARAFGRVPFLNGGLFARSHVEKAHSGLLFADEALGDLFGDLLTRFRFTAREESRSWSEAAIDPEMLGKAFEGLMDSTARRRSGAFYTPHSLVADLTHSALVHLLENSGSRSDDIEAALRGEAIEPALRVDLATRIDNLRVLDPACGSGAFLVHMLEELSRCRVRLDNSEPLHRVRRRMLTTSIFGVDVNPMAAWLCELRLWLSMAIEDPETNPMRVSPLPNLDRNIRVGDSLQGDDFSSVFMLDTARKTARLRSQYTRAAGPRKRTIARMLDTAERASAFTTVERRIAKLVSERRETLAAVRARDLFGTRPVPDPGVKASLSSLRVRIDASREELRRLRSGGALPFSFPSSFADVYAGGGFDVVIGNPPWIRTHNLDAESRGRLRRAFQVYAHSAWRSGSEAAAAGSGFASQVDSAALFLERSVMLARQSGVIALIVPAKLWRSLAGGGVREFLLANTELRELHDLTLASSVFDAVVYPSAIVARRSQLASARCVNMISHRGAQPVGWATRPAKISFDSSAGSPWMIVPADVRSAFDALRKAGCRLSDSAIGRPLLGVKTGCNEAFLVDRETANSCGLTLTRPVIRGESVTEWKIEPDDALIVWTHGDDNRPLPRLPLPEARWMARMRRELELRTDGRGQSRWWGLFRTESADAFLPRVVWADIGRSLRAAVLPAGNTSVPLNTCYASKCQSLRDAFALAAIMNSDVASAWLSILAEPARGGYRRYMAWTIALMPMPRDWNRALDILAPIGEMAFEGKPPSSRALRAAVLSAFGIDEAAITPLLEWTSSAS